MHLKNCTTEFLHTTCIGTWSSRRELELSHVNQVTTRYASHFEEMRLQSCVNQQRSSPPPSFYSDFLNVTLCWSLVDPVAMNWTEASCLRDTTTTQLVYDHVDVTACFVRESGVPPPTVRLSLHTSMRALQRPARCSFNESLAACEVLRPS
ncbi:hypothetical protein MRX96_055795 [Rhipicephalus microplus]